MPSVFLAQVTSPITTALWVSAGFIGVLLLGIFLGVLIQRFLGADPHDTAEIEVVDTDIDYDRDPHAGQ